MRATAMAALADLAETDVPAGVHLKALTAYLATHDTSGTQPAIPAAAGSDPARPPEDDPSPPGRAHRLRGLRYRR